MRISSAAPNVLKMNVIGRPIKKIIVRNNTITRGFVN
jgi:hypothetical protein